MTNAGLAEQSFAYCLRSGPAWFRTSARHFRFTVQSFPMSEYPERHLHRTSRHRQQHAGNLGPLTMAGIWRGTRAPQTTQGRWPCKQAYIERIELQPIDPQSNGPQLFTVCSITSVTKPDDVETYHSQVGYWLLEPATGMIDALADHSARADGAGHRHEAAANDREFELVTKRLHRERHLLKPVPEHAFRTDEFRIRVKISDNGTWTYKQDTMLKIRGQDELFHHTDRNTLTKIGEPTPNPLARKSSRLQLRVWPANEFTRRHRRNLSRAGIAQGAGATGRRAQDIPPQTRTPTRRCSNWSNCCR